MILFERVDLTLESYGLAGLYCKKENSEHAAIVVNPHCLSSVPVDCLIDDLADNGYDLVIS
jgi:hypothetical protein